MRTYGCMMIQLGYNKGAEKLEDGGKISLKEVMPMFVLAETRNGEACQYMKHEYSQSHLRH